MAGTPAALRCLVLFAALLPVACGGGGRDFVPPGTPGEPPVDEPAGPDLRLNTDEAGNELSLVPDVCCDGDRVYVTWYDRRNGNMDVYFSRSLDGGRTWLAADVRLDPGRPGAANSLVPRICCAGDRVYVAWYDDRGGQSDIYFNRSLDAGDTWLPVALRLDTDPIGAAQSREPQICCAENRVYVTWFDDRDGSWDIRLNRSLDAGDTWLADDLRVDHDPGPTSRADLPRIACDGEDVHVAWRDERGGGSDVYANRSRDGGLTWLAADVRLNTAGPGGLAGAPRLACAGRNVYAVWSDLRSGLADIRLNRSADGGDTWLADDLRLDGGLAGEHDSLEPDLCAEGDAVHVVWSDARHGAPDVYFQRSLDAGATWLATDLRLDDDAPGASSSLEPRLACGGGPLCVAWRDDREGRYDVLLTWSLDAGATWTRPERRLDRDPPGSAHSLSPVPCCGARRAGVAWYDQRHGPGDIYFNRVEFSQPPD